jgi:hypothetical protein
MFGPMEMGVQAKIGFEGCAQVPSRDGLVLGQGAYLSAPDRDVSEACAQRIVSVRFFLDGLKAVNVSCNFTFSCV